MGKFKLNILSFFSFVCVASVLSYYPVFQSISVSRYVVIFLWMLLCLFSLKRIICMGAEMKTVVFLYAMFILSSLISGFVNHKTSVFSNHFFMPVTIAVLVFASGYLSANRISREDILKLCRAYMYTTMAISILVFFFYLKDTDIFAYRYQYTYGKNEIAVLMMVAIIIACAVFKPKNKLQHIIRIVGVAFMCVDIFLLKCRTVMLALCVLLVLMLLIHGKQMKKTRIALLIAVPILAIVIISNDRLREVLVNQFLFANREAVSVDTVSSGRLTQIKRGWDVFTQNLLVGVADRGTLDCSYVSLLANYGLLAWPAISLALYPLLWGIRRLFRTRDPLTLCFFGVAVGMIFVSIFEERAPFGPGVRCFMLWLLWGLMAGQTPKEGENANEAHR